MKSRMLGLAALLALSSAAHSAETADKLGITPIQAELMADLNTRALKVGATVFARVTAEWQGADCALRNGAILEAHVLSVVPHTKTAKDSEVDLAFTRAQCGEPKLGAFGLTLAAMAAPPRDDDLGILSTAAPYSASGGRGPDGNIATLKRVQFTATTTRFDTELYQFPFVPNMKMGDVIGIKGLKLTVGAGSANTSVLTLAGHDVSLEKHTMLLLVPAQGTFPRAASAPGAPTASSATQPSPSSPPGGDAAASMAETASAAEPVAEDIDQCAPPQCNAALPSGAATEPGNAAASISISQFGFAPRPQRVIDAFDRDEAMAYLAPHQLLVAFNPHILAPRHTLGRAGPTLRVIRAVLVDTATRRVTRSVDWELADLRDYLWPLGENRVLVHVASELRMYGEGLKIENRIALDGPLAFVRVTPDGTFIAVGIVRERHSPELHAQLRESLGEEPEEDVDIQVFNRRFESIAKSGARSRLMPPTLLNEGQASVLAQSNMRYRISLVTWDDHASTVAQFHSSCAPEITSIAPDLLFLVSCDRQTGGRQYRVLHANGKMALKGDSTLNECGHAAAGSASRQEFVVKTVQSSLPVPQGALFSAGDFTSEELGVFRAEDGKRLLGVRVGSPSSSRDGYALAPDGSQLAVLTRDQIAIYPVPAK